MTEKEIYIDIAQRFINCCIAQIANGTIIQETIGFRAYHAFESIGGAFNSHLGHVIPKKHEQKLNLFVHNYKHHAYARINPTTIAKMAIILNSMRNKFLYPDNTPTGLKPPKEQLTIPQARKLTSQINGIINELNRIM